MFKVNLRGLLAHRARLTLTALAIALGTGFMAGSFVFTATLTRALDSLALRDPRQAKIIRIADTLSLDRVEVSEAYADAVRQRPDLEALATPKETAFDQNGNLAGLPF